MSKNLFDEVLINPAEGQGIDRLQIVSGFATANMADKHMGRLKSIKQPISIELIIGMPRRSGIGEAQHYALCKLAESRPYGLNFACRYVVKGNPVHAKTYCWFSGKKPIKAFVGSANYTLTGFGQSQVEAVKLAEAQTVADFQAGIRKLTADCLIRILLTRLPWPKHPGLSTRPPRSKQARLLTTPAMSAKPLRFHCWIEEQARHQHGQE